MGVFVVFAANVVIFVIITHNPSLHSLERCLINVTVLTSADLVFSTHRAIDPIHPHLPSFPVHHWYKSNACRVSRKDTLPLTMYVRYSGLRIY